MVSQVLCRLTLRYKYSSCIILRRLDTAKMTGTANEEFGEDKKHHATVMSETSSSLGDDAPKNEELAITRRKVDWRLIPTLGAVFGIAIVSRNNLSHAAIAGMLVDLDKTTGNGYK